MRGPLPLDDADFAAIRAQVMAKIDGRRLPLWRFAYAALVVAVFSIVVGRQPAVRPSPAPFASLRGHPLPLTRERVAVVAAVAPLPHAGEGGAKRRVRVAHHPKPSPQVARMEIQTADPNVRIIWITN